MTKAILPQAVAAALAAVFCGLVAGSRGSLSAALGGAVYLFPNLLFALRLETVSARRAGFLVNFLLGEFVKLFAVAGLLFFAAREFAGFLHWPSLLVGLVFTTQAMFFAFWKKS